jgi:hypothetical protein
MPDAAVDYTSVSSYSAESGGGTEEPAILRNDTSREGPAELWRLLVSGTGEELQRIAVPIPFEATEIEADQSSGILVSERAALASEIIAYCHLHEDWDGEGGVSPSREAVGDALAFLELLPLKANLPKSTVSGDGEVGFYWKAPNGYIDVGFLGDGQIRYYGRLDIRGHAARGPRPYSGLALPRDLLDMIDAI